LGLVTALVACGDQFALEVGPGETDDGNGKADSAATRAELKASISPSDIRRARYRLALLNARSQERGVWFYDTLALELFDAGTILRGREIEGDDDDSTVKLRPFTRDQLAPQFRALDDLKCEIDRLPDTETPSCSLKIKQDEGEIAAVGRGTHAIDQLFSSEQEAMFAAYGPAIPLVALRALGPIHVRVWTLRSEELPEKLTAELWYMPDGAQTLELSMKVDTDDADSGMAKLLHFIDDRGLTLDKEQESKTRRALEALVATAQAE